MLKKLSIVLMLFFIITISSCEATYKNHFILLDVQEIYTEIPSLSKAIFYNPINKTKLSFNYFNKNNSLLIYQEANYYSKASVLKFINIKDLHIHIKQFIDKNTKKVFYSIDSNPNAFDKNTYLLSINDKEVKIYFNADQYSNILTEKYTPIPLVRIDNKNSLYLSYTYLCGNNSQEYTYLLEYDAVKDEFALIDKGLYSFNFDEYRYGILE